MVRNTFTLGNPFLLSSTKLEGRLGSLASVGQTSWRTTLISKLSKYMGKHYSPQLLDFRESQSPEVD